jgi:hypothetical protein
LPELHPWRSCVSIPENQLFPVLFSAQDNRVRRRRSYLEVVV